MKTEQTIITIRYESPAGILLLGSCNDSLCLASWLTQKCPTPEHMKKGAFKNMKFEEGTSPILTAAVEELDLYFAGKLQEFSIRFVLSGTDFQRRVWEALLRIPYASTSTYKEIANSIGMPLAVRAVANAIGANPISIFVPCHRVIGSDGTLTGYAGGLSVKQQLIELEAIGLSLGNG